MWIRFSRVRHKPRSSSTAGVLHSIPLILAVGLLWTFCLPSVSAASVSEAGSKGGQPSTESCPAFSLSTNLQAVAITTLMRGDCPFASVATSEGQVYGSSFQPPLHLNAPIIGIAAANNSAGYWLAGADGGVFAFGGAGFFGSAATMRLNAPILGITATADAKGYFLAAADGGVFAFGDAVFQGSMANRDLNAPVVGIAADSNSTGYRLVAADGGVFDFGAPFFGSEAGEKLNQPVVGIATDPSTGGYWIGAADGGVFAFHAAFDGSLAAAPSEPVVGITSGPSRGYSLADRIGNLTEFSPPKAPLADDLTAQANLEHARLNAEAFFTENALSYTSTGALVSALATYLPEFSFTAGPSTDPSNVSVTTSADGNSAILAVRSADGNCWYIILNTGSAETSSPPWSTPGAVFVHAGIYWGGVQATGSLPTCQASSTPAGANSATRMFSQSGAFPVF
jgi:hypothetical protein